MRRCRIESLGVSLPGGGLFAKGSLKHAVAAGKRCLAGSHYNPSDVRVLVNAGIHRDGHICEPAIAAYVQHGLGINVEFQGRRTLAFDLHNGGCGMLNAAHVVSGLLQAGEADVGMVVSSEANSDADPDPGYTYAPSGAAALLDLSPKRDVGFGAFAFHTHEEHAELYRSVVSLAVKKGKLLLRKEQAALEAAWLKHSRAVIDEVLEKERWSREEVDLVVPAQISSAFLQALPEAIGLPREKVADYTAKLPDTLTTSVFLAMHEAMEAGRVAGKRLLLLAVGSGITVGAAAYRG